MSAAMRSRRFGLIAAIAVVSMALTGCISTPPVAESGTSVPSALQRFYGQGVSWSKCESAGLTCATVTAPIDWAKPASGTVKLALIRHVTTSSKRVGSLLVNPGGPGGSGYEMVRDGVKLYFDDDLRASFDVVGWDPRGVGRSDPIKCLTDAQNDDFLYGLPAAPEGSDAWLASRVPIEKAYAAACAKNTGPLLGHLDAESNARDMDLIRALLGDRKLDYLGFSYGTFFGAHYAKLFPKNVGRLVLDGPVDPAVSEPQDFVTQMAGFETSYRAFLADCLTGSCPFSGTVDDALAQSKALFDRVGTAGLQSSDGRYLTLSSLGTALSYPLYSQSSWPALKGMISDLQRGSVDRAISFADGYNGRDDDGHYSEGNAVYTSALCLDGVFSTDLAGTRATMDAIAAAAPTNGALYTYSDWAHFDNASQNWAYPSVLKAGAIPAKGAAPIMVVGTTSDPATPYTGAVSLAKQLDSGFLVTRNGEGHTAYGSGNACIDKTVDSYLITGSVPSSDPLC
ncbi:MAG: peptidase [Microbacteriaceae bacterium]|nr:peptidase [Microbacteriaceae bacterium]